MDGQLFRLYWLDGSTNLLRGDSIEHAFTQAGYGNGASGAVDFYDTQQDITHRYTKGEGWVGLAFPVKDILEIRGNNAVWVNHNSFNVNDLYDLFGRSYSLLLTTQKERALNVKARLEAWRGPEQFGSCYPGIRPLLGSHDAPKWQLAEEQVSFFVMNTDPPADRSKILTALQQS